MYELDSEQVEWLRGCIRIKLRCYCLSQWDKEDIAGACWFRLVKGYVRFDPAKGRTANAWRNYGITIVNNTILNEVKKICNYRRVFPKSADEDE